MKKLITILLLVCLLSSMAFGATSRRYYNFGIYREDGNVESLSCAITIYIGGGGSDVTSSCYTTRAGSTAASLTAITSGEIAFWTSYNPVDVRVIRTDPDAGTTTVKLQSLGPADHYIEIPRDQVVLGNVSFGSIDLTGPLTTVGDVTLGVTGTGTDFKAWADTSGDYMLWDEDNEALEFVGAEIHTDDDSLWEMGSDKDVTFQFDGTNLELFAIAADTPFAIGGTSYGFDLTYAFEGAGQFRTDFDGDFINLTDDMELRLGAGASSDGDFKISSNSSNVLEVERVVPGIGSMVIKPSLSLETTYIEFRENPVTSILEGGAAGTTGTNLMLCGYPAVSFEYFIIGTQTKTAPIIGTHGLNIAMDAATSDGAEITEGITARSRSAFTSGTDSFYLEVVFYVTDADGSSDMRIGFRKAMAYDATLDDYDEMQAVGLLADDWTSWTINGDGATDIVDIDDPTGGDCGDTESHTIRIEINSDLSTNYTLEGEVVTAFPDTDVETGIVFIPFFYYISASATAEGLMITSWECGLL